MAIHLWQWLFSLRQQKVVGHWWKNFELCWIRFSSTFSTFCDNEAFIRQTGLSYYLMFEAALWWSRESEDTESEPDVCRCTVSNEYRNAEECTVRLLLITDTTWSKAFRCSDEFDLIYEKDFSMFAPRHFTMKFHKTHAGWWLNINNWKTLPM